VRVGKEEGIEYEEMAAGLLPRHRGEMTGHRNIKKSEESGQHVP